VLWSASGKATVLHDAGGAGVSSADAINDAGQSVGLSYTTSSASGADAVLWSPSGKATVLQGLGPPGPKLRPRHQRRRVERWSFP